MTAAPMSRDELVSRLRTHWDTGFALDDLVTAAADMLEADGLALAEQAGALAALSAEESPNA